MKHDAVSDLDETLERRLADGSITVEDADAIRDFAAFLTDPSSRCAICLTDDSQGASWRTHQRLGRVFICRTCTPTS